MFEVPQDKEETKTMRLFIGGGAVVVILILVIVYFATRRGEESPAVSAAPTAACTPDPVADLRVLSAKMDKDVTGNWAVWVVRLQNKSAGCVYSEIQYETTYLRGDNSVVVANKATLPDMIGPGETRTYSDFRDVLFPAGAAWAQFKILAAKSAAP